MTCLTALEQFLSDVPSVFQQGITRQSQQQSQYSPRGRLSALFSLSAALSLSRFCVASRP